MRDAALETTESRRVTIGGRKYDAGKIRYDLIPPEALGVVANVFGIGAEKYGDRNWEQGIEWGRIFAAMQRHAWAWWSGERNDPEDGQHHLASVAWCALVLLTYEDTHPELDARPSSPVPRPGQPQEARGH